MHPLIRRWTPIISNLILSLVATHGVYTILRVTLGPQFAAIGATAFELVYLSLAVAYLYTESQRIMAYRLSLGAVTVSVLMNVTSTLLARRPWIADWTIPIPEATNTLAAWSFDIFLSLLTGVPLASLAYFLSTIVLHASSDIDYEQVVENFKILKGKAEDWAKEKLGYEQSILELNHAVQKIQPLQDQLVQAEQELEKLRQTQQLKPVEEKPSTRKLARLMIQTNTTQKQLAQEVLQIVGDEKQAAKVFGVRVSDIRKWTQ